MKILLIIFPAALSLTAYCQEVVDYQVKNRQLRLFDRPEGNLLIRIPKNKVVTLMAFDENCNCFNAAYKELRGFIPSNEWLNDIVPKTKKQWLNGFPDEKVRKVMTAHNLILELNENGTYILEKKTETEAVFSRTAEMTRKYGYTNGKRIAEGKLWLGMTTDMALDSWGIPYRVNRSHGNWGKQEQWIYSSAYLYFENGFLTEILKITSASN